VSTLAEKVVAIHHALEQAQLPHAFGGALALAWCTQRARGTIDIDVNVFADHREAAAVLSALPDGVRSTADDVARCVRDGQVRLWWDTTPVDIFTNTTAFHEAALDRVVVHEFIGVAVPFLGCGDLAVFKAFFDRTKDWADIEEMISAGTFDGDRVLGVLVRHLGTGDARVDRLRTLLGPPG
jgi:hypothetical protein